jgi:hypothetical protein
MLSFQLIAGGRSLAYISMPQPVTKNVKYAAKQNLGNNLALISLNLLSAIFHSPTIFCRK